VHKFFALGLGELGKERDAVWSPSTNFGRELVRSSEHVDLKRSGECREW
jgi:hypothetical protein